MSQHNTGSEQNLLLDEESGASGRPGFFRRLSAGSMALIGVGTLALGSAGALTVDYLDDGQSQILQLLGLEKGQRGSHDMSDSPVGAGDGTGNVSAGDVGSRAMPGGANTDRTGSLNANAATGTSVYGNPYAVTYQAGNDGLPITGMDGIDLSGISRGGGYGPDRVDWSKIAPSSLSIPQAALMIPYVEEGVHQIGTHQYSMTLPVSFQAGWLNSSSPVDAHAGSTVIAAHVNWADGSWAPMSNLYNAKPGMRVITSNADGARQNWTVVSEENVDQTRLSHLFRLQDRTGSRQLIMITCQPTQDASGNTVYTHNHVVVAKPAS